MSTNAMPDSFRARLAALRYPKAASFDASNRQDALALYVFLEDKHIRQLPEDERGPLRSHEVAAVQAYMHECQAPDEILTHLESGQHRPVCSWLLCLALQYEYSDRKVAYDDAYRVTASTTPSIDQTADLIAPDDDDLRRLAKALNAPMGPDATATVQAVVKAARSAPRRTVTSAASTAAPTAQPELNPPQMKSMAVTAHSKPASRPALKPDAGMAHTPEMFSTKLCLAADVVRLPGSTTLPSILPSPVIFRPIFSHPVPSHPIPSGPI